LIMPTDVPQAQTVLLTSDLGSVGNYDPTTPLAIVTSKESLLAGRLYLRATLDEMIRIRAMSKRLHEDHHDLLRDTKAQYDHLLRQQTELELFKRQSWIHKLFRLKPVKRAERTFASDACELWDSTATTSNKMKGALLSLSTDLAPVQSESVNKDERVSGLALTMNGPVTQEAIDTVREAASIVASSNCLADPTPPDSQHGQTSRTTLVDERLSSARTSITTSPSSPGSASRFRYINLNINHTVVNNTASIAPGLTINNNGSGNRGSDHRSFVNSTPGPS